MSALLGVPIVSAGLYVAASALSAKPITQSVTIPKIVDFCATLFTEVLPQCIIAARAGPLRDLTDFEGLKRLHTSKNLYTYKQEDIRFHPVGGGRTVAESDARHTGCILVACLSACPQDAPKACGLGVSAVY